MLNKNLSIITKRKIAFGKSKVLSHNDLSSSSSLGDFPVLDASRAALMLLVPTKN